MIQKVTTSDNIFSKTYGANFRQNYLSQLALYMKIYLYVRGNITNIIRQIKSRQMRWAGHMARMGEDRQVYKVLVGKPGGKRPLGRPRRGWEDGIRMVLRQIGWGCELDSTVSGYGPVASFCECSDERSGPCSKELVT
jgi:hypothetical protein